MVQIKLNFIQEKEFKDYNRKKRFGNRIDCISQPRMAFIAQGNLMIAAVDSGINQTNHW